MENINITYNNNIYKVRKNITIEEFISDYINPVEKTKMIQDGSIYVGATINNVPQELTYSLAKDCTIELLDTTTSYGEKIYRTSLSYLFLKAVYDVLNKARVELCHTLSKGQYCEIQGYENITEEEINKVEARMNELVRLNYPIEKTTLTKEDALDLFSKIKKQDHVNLLNTTYKETVNIYTLDGYISFFNNLIVPSTGYIKKFKIVKEGNGVVLLYPKRSNPLEMQEHTKQEKLLAAFNETKRWGKIMNVNYVSDLNNMIVAKKHNELIGTVEALQEKKIVDIAQTIYNNNKRVILIAGPSSSGKTTTSRRVATQLKVLGLNPIAISLDDYFINAADTPLDEFGEKDFESIYALDLELFNKDLKALLNGEEIELPSYNFSKGIREYKGHKLKITDNQPIILEGIHALNPLLTTSIKDDMKFKLYIAPVTQLNLDNHNRLSSTDCRLIRRIVRDSKYRGSSAENTFSMWASVRRGEEKNIFPYQQEADIIFNSTLIYELPVLKKYIEPLLISVNRSSMYYKDAKRLLDTLSYFILINEEDSIPPNSIIREFIGNQFV